MHISAWKQLSQKWILQIYRSKLMMTGTLSGQKVCCHPFFVMQLHRHILFSTDEEEVFDSDFQSTDDEVVQNDDAGDNIVQEEERRARKVRITSYLVVKSHRHARIRQRVSVSLKLQKLRVHGRE